MLIFFRRQPEKALAVWVTSSAMLLVLSFAVCLNRALILSGGWKSTELVGIRHESGFAYQAPTHHDELSSHEGPSPAQVWEDGRPLPGPPNAAHDDIRGLGHGRYSFWHGSVYFAPSDNTDPATSGRRYVIHYPWTVGWIPAFVLYAATLLACARAYRFAAQNRELPAVKAATARARQVVHSFRFSALLLLTVVLITRLPFFVHYPLVGLSSDTNGYMSLVDTVRHGQWPQFIIRTPGYPFLVWLVTAFTDRWVSVILVQCLISLGAGLCLIYAVYRFKRNLVLPAALAMCAFLGGAQSLTYDTMGLPESIYTSALLFTVAALLMAFSQPRPCYFALLSASMAVVILIRPSGMFLLVVYFLILAFLLWNRFPTRAVVNFIVPLPAILLALCTYNYFTIQAFTVSPYGEANFAGATALYWETDPSLPPFVNEALKELPASYKRSGISDRDLQIMRTSWDIRMVYDVFSRAYNPMMHDENWGYGTKFNHGSYLEVRRYVRAACLVAIRRHPDLYLKFFWVNLVTFFEGIDYRFDFDAILDLRARQNYLGGKIREYDTRYIKEYGGATPPAGVFIAGTGANAEVTLSLPVLHRIQLAWQSLHVRVFEKIFWVWIYLFVLALSAVELVRSRGRNIGAFILLMLTLMFLGAGMVVCLVEEAMDRYSYPVQFIYYLSIALLPLIWTTMKSPLCMRTSPTADERKL